MWVTYDSSNNITKALPTASFPDPAQANAYPLNFSYLDDLDPIMIAWCAQNSTVSFLQFVQLFTQPEQAALALSQDATTRVFMMQAMGAGALQMSNSMVIEGVNYVASIGLIANTRINSILTGQVPGSN